MDRIEKRRKFVYGFVPVTATVAGVYFFLVHGRTESVLALSIWLLLLTTLWVYVTWRFVRLETET
ncbi:MAG: hypothetical protein ACOCT0_02695 [Halobacteriota archaeon]